MAKVVEVDGTGIRALSTADTLAEYRQRYQEAFGEDLAMEPETPQGQISGIDSLALAQMGESLVQEGMAASVDHAGGTLLDALGSLLDIGRRDNTFSRVTATLTGVAGTGVPTGSRAKTAAGDEFATLADVVLSPSGVSVSMQALEPGPIEAAAAALTSIVTVIPGWETITNPNAAVLGVARDLDQVYREQYKLRTAQRSIGPSPALESAQAEAGAARSKVTENNTDLAIIVQQWTIFPHAILVMVEGGSDNDVRRAVENHRGMGAGTGAAVIGGTPSTLNTLQGITNGTLTWDGEDYTGVNLSSAADFDGVATLINALTDANSNPIPIVMHYEQEAGGRFVAVYRWHPDESPTFGTSTAEQRLAIRPADATQSPGPFVRAVETPLTISFTVTRRAGYPADGLNLIREAVIQRVAEYGIGEQVWANDILCAAEAIPGTRITALSVQENSRDVSGVAIPLDVVWTLPTGNLSVTIT